MLLLSQNARLISFLLEEQNNLTPQLDRRKQQYPLIHMTQQYITSDSPDSDIKTNKQTNKQFKT